MAKNGSKTMGWIRLVVYLAIVLVSVVLAYATLTKESALQAATIESNVEDIASLEIEGCKPAKTNDGRLTMLEYKWKEIDKTQTAIHADTREILKRLPK